MDEGRRFLVEELLPPLVESAMRALAPYFGFSGAGLEEVPRPRITLYADRIEGVEDRIVQGAEGYALEVNPVTMSMRSLGRAVGRMLYEEANPHVRNEEDRLKVAMVEEAQGLGIPELRIRGLDEGGEAVYEDESDGDFARIIEEAERRVGKEPMARVVDPVAYLLERIEQRDPRIPASAYAWHAHSNAIAFFEYLAGCIFGEQPEREELRRIRAAAQEALPVVTRMEAEREPRLFLSMLRVAGGKLKEVPRANGFAIADVLYRQQRERTLADLPRLVTCSVAELDGEVRQRTGLRLVYVPKGA